MNCVKDKLFSLGSVDDYGDLNLAVSMITRSRHAFLSQIKILSLHINDRSLWILITKKNRKFRETGSNWREKTFMKLHKFFVVDRKQVGEPCHTGATKNNLDKVGLTKSNFLTHGVSDTAKSTIRRACFVMPIAESDLMVFCAHRITQRNRNCTQTCRFRTHKKLLSLNRIFEENEYLQFFFIF